MKPKLPIYQQVIRDIAGKIEDGFYPQGSCLPSRSKLCHTYNISNMTAVKVQTELVRLGIAFGVNGKGIFVSSCQKNSKGKKISKKGAHRSPLQIVVSHIKEFDKKPHATETVIYKKILERANELNIPVRLLSKNSEKKFKFAEDEVFIGSFSSLDKEVMMGAMFNTRLKSVLINNIFTHSYCIMNDNYSGITQLIDYLTSQNCRNLILATKHFNHLGIANLSERTYAFKNECKRRNLPHQVIESGNYNDLLNLVSSSNPPDGIMFSTDSPALKFEKILAEKKVSKRPIITGFDGGLKTVKVSVKVDFEAMGKAAVDIVKSNSLSDWSQRDVIRIPCKLRINK
jgi:DNA-binding transcriptional regulator YhcF (GntR family)